MDEQVAVGRLRVGTILFWAPVWNIKKNRGWATPKVSGSLRSLRLRRRTVNASTERVHEYVNIDLVLRLWWLLRVETSTVGVGYFPLVTKEEAPTYQCISSETRFAKIIQMACRVIVPASALYSWQRSLMKERGLMNFY